MAKLPSAENMNTAENTESAEAAATAVKEEILNNKIENATSFMDEEPASSAVAVQGSSSQMHSIAASDDGFDALDGKVGFGAFPNIKLDKDKFVVDNDELDSFDCVLQAVKSKYLYKADDDNLFYSYDKIRDTSGKLVSARLKEWSDEGFNTDEIEIKEYLEVVAMMKNTKLAGRFAILSIPPASARRISGYRMEIRAIHGVSLDKVVTRCLKGSKVTVGKNTFYPWDFSFISAV